MPGNRQAYEEAMSAGDIAAWEREWAAAISAYGRAIQEFPEDPHAHNNLGLMLLQAGRLDDALKVYTRAHQLAPTDPIPLEKSADVLERMGRLREAAQQYVNVAEIYLGQRDLNKAISTWEKATRLSPGFGAAHAKLAQAYERIGDRVRAIYHYHTLAFNFQRAKETDRAIKAVQRALRLDSKNATSLNMLRALETGGEIAPPPPLEDAPDTRADKTLDFDSLFADTDERAHVGESDPLGPMGEAMTEALGLMAEFVMESGNLDAYGSQALLALEMQRQGMHREAIAAYEQAEPGLRHPSLKLSLGVLLLLENQPDKALTHLGEAITHPDLSAGALHALGVSYYRLNKHKQALRYLIQSLQAVDTSLAADVDEVAELTEVYDRLMMLLDGRPDEGLATVNTRFVGLLQGKDWKQRIAETRRQIQEIMRSGGDQGVVEFIQTDHSDEITLSVAAIDSYLRQGLLTLAMDEAHRTVEFAPNYLPVHVRMAEIMMREGRVRQAINKYNIVARTYLVRGENDRAASILGEVLEMAPLDVTVRTNLIELLETEERWDEALDQYVDLADTYHQLGDFDMSRNTYNVAERLAMRVQAAPEKIVRIKHRIADIDQMRLDIRRAQRTYEEIIQIDPNDERARRMLIDLNYRQGSHVEALKRLDELLKIYARSKQVNKITQLLEELVTLYPNDTGLRSRLAAIYRQLGRTRDTILQLDALGELQLEAGLHEEAINTLRQIIALKPEGVEDYKRLLAQLGG
jgi:tetratricopeptide (TPR) repeat protein